MPAAYFIDLDGTIFKHGTNQLLPGARQLLDAITERGNEIVFTTFRGDLHFSGHRVYSREGAMEGIRSLKVSYKTVLFDIDSPRVVINDGGAAGINHAKNEPWTEDEITATMAAGDE
jgi:hypothetical protein